MTMATTDTITRQSNTFGVRQKFDHLVEMSLNLEKLRFDQKQLRDTIDPEVYQELQDVLGTDKEVENAEQVIIKSLAQASQLLDYPDIEQAKADGILTEKDAAKAVRIKREMELSHARQPAERSFER